MKEAGFGADKFLRSVSLRPDGIKSVRAAV